MALGATTTGPKRRPSSVRHDEAPARSCVVCRAVRPPEALVALGVIGNEVVLGARGGARGAHVCLDRECLETCGPKHLARAFRRAVHVTTPLVELAHALAERKLYELVGLARRQGSLEIGVDRLEALVDDAQAAAQGVWIVAADISERSRRRLGERVRLFGDAERLGRASGLGRVGALRIGPGALAKQAAYWLQLWYETAPSGTNEVDDG